MTNHYETEVKLYVPDLHAAATQLAAAGATLAVPRVFERNVRYEDRDNTLSSRDVVLRLRQDNRVRLTYKEGGTAQDGIVSRLEAEVEVSDFEKMQFILSRLGFAPAMIYEKYRTTYHLGDTEIVLDEMPFGNFVEIEGEHQAIEAVITTLGWGANTRIPASYVRLFGFLRTRMGLTFNDMTFDNFKGIIIPSNVFGS